VPRILFSVHVKFAYASKPPNQNLRKLDGAKEDALQGCHSVPMLSLFFGGTA